MRIPLFLKLALTVTALASTEPQDQNQERANAATRAIYGVLVDNGERPQRCMYDIRWDRYPVPAGLAREVLGLTMDVDVVASQETLSIQDVIDPNKAADEIFCSEKDYRSYLEQRASTSEKAPAHRIDLTYPVFDEPHKVAIVIVTRTEDGGLYLLPDGKARKRASESSVIAFVLNDLNGKWHVVRSETLAAT